MKDNKDNYLTVKLDRNNEDSRKDLLENQIVNRGSNRHHDVQSSLPFEKAEPKKNESEDSGSLSGALIVICIFALLIFLINYESNEILNSQDSPEKSNTNIANQIEPDNSNIISDITIAVDEIKNIATELDRIEVTYPPTGASYRLAKMYYYGIEKETDISKAEYWFKVASKYSINALNYIGIIELSKSNYSEAFRMFSEATAKGSASGSYNKAMCYYHGVGTRKNLLNAGVYFRKSADKGLMNAQEKVMLMYCYGLGFSRNLNTAKYYCSLAAEGGSALAVYFKEQMILDTYLIKDDDFKQLAENINNNFMKFETIVDYDEFYKVKKLFQE